MRPLPLSFRMLKRQGPSPGGGRACRQGTVAADGRHLRRHPRAGPRDQCPRAGAVPGVAGRGRLPQGPGGPAHSLPGPGAARQQPGHQVVKMQQTGPVGCLRRGVSETPEEKAQLFFHRFGFQNSLLPIRGCLLHSVGALSHRMCDWDVYIERRIAVTRASFYPKTIKPQRTRMETDHCLLGLKKKS